MLIEFLKVTIEPWRFATVPETRRLRLQVVVKAAGHQQQQLEYWHNLYPEDHFESVFDIAMREASVAIKRQMKELAAEGG
jgi:hypothetical protein